MKNIPKEWIIEDTFVNCFIFPWAASQLPVASKLKSITSHIDPGIWSLIYMRTPLYRVDITSNRAVHKYRPKNESFILCYHYPIMKFNKTLIVICTPSTFKTPCNEHKLSTCFYLNVFICFIITDGSSPPSI